MAFPNPVNEKAARVVAGVVVVISVVILATGAYWLLIPLAYGFWARVLTGPTLSPLGWTAQNVIAAAGLESIFGYCLGCKVFALLMRAGLVPEGVCAECADISARLSAAR